MTDSDYSASINTQYAVGKLAETILDALKAAGKNPEFVTPDDLAPLDHFHTRGKEATLALARMAGLQSGTRVLDVGGGLGGPARTLAADFGCSVTVLDLTEEFCQAGEMLTARTRLAGQVRFQHGSALDMPFDNASFDVAWTQHSSMNIANKERLYTEIHRVLRPGGRLTLHEIMAGSVEPIHFPVPWASEPSISFLRPAEEVHQLLTGLGFTDVAWLDVTDQTREFTRRMAAQAQPGTPAPALGLHVVVPNAPEKFRTLTRNIEENRVAIIQAVFDRP